MCTGRKVQPPSFHGARVSIPCKRESTCAHGRRNKRSKSWTGRFHSLQTGKHMCTMADRFSLSFFWSFHSLQTGKHMCTKICKGICLKTLISVSIPCKRESTCALTYEAFIGTEKVGFHSLQTGKHMCTGKNERNEDVFLGGGVSIPCKRESTCAQANETELKKLEEEFPFPANGKAHVHALLIVYCVGS